ncbi:unnamed protein product, partial [Ixodes hexagonus]
FLLLVLDSTAKYPTGLLQGSKSDLGSFDECIGTVIHDNYGNERIRGQYCNLDVKMANDTSLLEIIGPALLMSNRRALRFMRYQDDPRVSGVRLGICTTDDCSDRDLQALFETRKFVDGKALVQVNNCVTSQRPPMTKVQISIIAVLGLLAALIVAATSCEAYSLFKKEKAGNSKSAKKCFLAFSLIANTKMLLSVDKSKLSDSHKLRFLHGIRFFSGLWVVLGHGSCIFDDSSSGQMNILHYTDQVETSVISASFMSVDSFFFVSGFLLTYTLLKVQRSGVIFTLVAIARRVIRANIPVFFALMCLYVVPLFATGPNSEELYNTFYEQMGKHWWELLLQVRNFGKEMEMNSLSHLWYISADFQLFLIALVLLQVFQK